MSKQSDLASVGYMLIELLSGKPVTDAVPDPDDSTRAIGTDVTQELLKAKQALPDRLPEILPPNLVASKHLVQLCRCLIDPDLNQRFPSAAESIVDRKGTYEFNKDLILSNLGGCNYAS
jgi:serine/threonine-protein kinase